MVKMRNLELQKHKKIYSVIVITEIIFILTAIIAAIFLERDKTFSRNNIQNKKTLAVLPTTTTNTDSLSANGTTSLPIIPDPAPLIDNDNFDKYYDYPPVEQKDGTVRIPVLTYHHIAPIPTKGSGRDYYVSPEMFDKQMAYLRAKNYRTLSMQEFYNQLLIGKNPSQKSVLITFDDGNRDNYIYAFPILKKYGFKATFFIVSNKSGIRSSELQEMTQAGMDIESHSQTHRDLVKLTDENEVNNEVGGSKASLAYMSDSSVIAISYPGCVANSQTIKHVASVGYLLGFTCSKKIDNSYKNRYTLNRVHIYSNLENFKQRLSGICNYTKSFE